MPGHQDRVADQGRDQEPQRAHEGRARADGLRERLERLPPGHPSSPYTADGSRRPAAPGLDGRELPLREGSGPGPVLDGESRPDSPADSDKARIGADGSWEWKGRHLAPEQSRIADQALARCLAAEGRDTNGNYTDRGLTPAMRRIEAQLEHGHLVEDTEKYALKSPDRFKEKLADMISAEPDKGPAEHAEEIHDGVRFTYIFEPDRYTNSARELIERVSNYGFELGVRKNTWGHDEYKGINTRWLDSATGIRFEIQLHTRESWDAKQTTHAAYEKINDIRTHHDERERLRDHQRQISSKIISPIRCEEIVDYRRETW